MDMSHDSWNLYNMDLDHSKKLWKRGKWQNLCKCFFFFFLKSINRSYVVVEFASKRLKEMISRNRRY